MTTLLQKQRLSHLPTEDDLPETDNKPVDNELQILIPVLLRAILALAWADRMDWFFGVNLGVYSDPDGAAIAPDGFISKGVERVRKSGKLRLNYTVWQEGVIPQWVLEVVSKTPGREYDRSIDDDGKLGKMGRYAEMGALYYTIYNPNHGQRDKHDPFEVYRLIDGVYVRQTGNPVWMPEVGLGIGTGQGKHEGYKQEWLYWYDLQGNRYPAPESVIQQERQSKQRAEQRAKQAELRAEQAENQLEQLSAKLRTLNPEQLRALGINPDLLQ